MTIKSDHLNLLLEILNTGTLGGQQSNNTVLAAHVSQTAKVLGINMNLNQYQNLEISEDITEEKNFLASLNANHIDAYAIKSEPFQRTNLEFRPHKLKYPKPVGLQTNPTLFPVKNIPVVELDNETVWPHLQRGLPPHQAYPHTHGKKALRMLYLFEFLMFKTEPTM